MMNTVTDNPTTDDVIVESFIDAMGFSERETLAKNLKLFVCRHAYQNRPIALVSSGGTVTDLEIQSVRCIDNFSTGRRGAISVEELLKRGYAVIHLWRKGSASPYGRILSELIMGRSSSPNHGITIGSLGKLFSTGDVENDIEDQLVQDVLSQHNTTKRYRERNMKGAVKLHRRILNSDKLQSALIERQSALEENRLLTVPFRSVEDYIAKLKLSSESIRDRQAMAIFYLCAAVSDFYVPMSQRSKHKIQSSDVANQNSKPETNISCYHLTLFPVPKVMGLLRRKWAPNAFVCSFKLETDRALLRTKAEGAIQRYGCHMVIGNILETRHDQVWILAPYGKDRSCHSVQEWPMKEISKPTSSQEIDALETLIMEHVVQNHFEYISLSENLDQLGTKLVLRAHIELEQKRRNVGKERFWNGGLKKTALEWAGILAGAAVSFAISTALKRRINM